MYEFLAILVVILPIFFFYKNHPPTPPCETQMT